MPRLTPAQICYGTLAVVIATVALLAATGTHSLLTTALVAILGITLGTIAAALAITAPARHAAADRQSLLVTRNRPGAAPDAARTGSPTVESRREEAGARR